MEHPGERAAAEAAPAASQQRASAPFDSLAFTLVEARGRSLLRLMRGQDGLYDLQVQQGSGGNPKVDFTRKVPQATAQALKDALQAAGVFGWRERYGDLPGFGMLRWTLRVVFKRDVFTFSSEGGSDVPGGFDAMMEQFYRLDLPRPGEASSAAWPAEAAGLGAGGLGALDSVPLDFGQLGELFSGAGMDGFAGEQLREAMQLAQSDPAAFQGRLRGEFASMPRAEQDALIDQLAALGLASRAWWERFLRGE